VGLTSSTFQLSRKGTQGSIRARRAFIHWRFAGDILHPEHETAEILLGIKRDMGSMQISAQYQQTPVPEGGTFIKRKRLKTYSQSPLPLQHRDRMIISWHYCSK
jgi:hypothetical protein